MKKGYLFKGLLVVFALLCSHYATAYSFRTDGIYYNILSEDDLTCEVTGRYSNSSNSNTYKGNVVIPETTTYLGKTYSVVAIGDYAFRSCSSLTEITIPNSVTSIGKCAFDGCSSLLEVTIPNSVTSLGESAFYDCSSLLEVTIGNSVTSIGDYTFYNCSSLLEVTIGNSVKSIGSSAFSQCSSLTEVTIPNSVKSLGESAFYNCSSLLVVTIGNSVTSIGKTAFYQCSCLRSLTSLNVSPPQCYDGGSNSRYNSFYGVLTYACVLYVPLGTTKNYSVATGWKDFYYIEEIDTSGIDDIVNSEDATEVARYTVSGQKITTPQKGINIVRYSDGTTMKILVQ